MFFKDIAEALKIFPVWCLMSKYDIVARYRRTAFGPWWITLGTGCALLGMGIVWSTLFKMDIRDLFPYLSIGFVFWTFISSTIMESPLVLVSASNVFKTIKISPIIFIFNALLRNIIMLLHNFVIVLIVFIIFKLKISLNIFLFIPGLMILFVTSFFVSLILSILGSRLRDLSYIIGSLMTFIFLITPIMWKVDMLPGNAKYIAYLNPITYFIMILREPLLNKIPDMVYYYGAFGVLGIVTILAIVLYNKASKNIIYWVI